MTTDIRQTTASFEDVTESDLLVIGMGIAGLSAAYAAAELGHSVVILTKTKDVSECNTYYAQGGIIGDIGPQDAPLLKGDIERASHNTSYGPAADLLSTKGPALVNNILIDKVGVGFAKNPDGQWDFTQEAAHSCRRILHVQDQTGKGIIEAFDKKVLAHPNISVLNDTTAIDLITTHHHSLDPEDAYHPNVCLGCYALDNTNGQVRRFFAKATLLATGGIGNIFLHTTNPSCATGDGIAMAHRAGAKITNARFVQFHPTTLYHGGANNFLISESLRGEGAKLLDLALRPFMANYDPQLLDLAPRDVVARAIYDQMTKLDQPHVYLDIANNAPPELNIKERFPAIHAKCQEHGIDIESELIPVVPAAHYFCGGLLVDLYGRSTLSGLYAAGEVSCTGLHGANRLASTSLLEGLTWGFQAVEHNQNELHKPFSRDLASIIPQWEGRDYAETDPLLVNQDWLMVKYTMWNYAGIIRTKKRLQRATQDLSYLSHRIMKFYNETKLTQRLIELRNGLLVAQLVVQDALQHPHSQGCHYVLEE